VWKPRDGLPNQERIITELFIDRIAALYIGETWTRVVINGGDKPAVIAEVLS